MTPSAPAPSVVRLTEELRGGAEAIVRSAYGAARAAFPALPADPTIPGLGHFVGNGMGVAAVTDAGVIGFLAAYPPFDGAYGVPGLRGSYAPVEAFGIADDLPAGVTRAALVTRLYTAAAAVWSAQRAFSHSVAVWAHDAEATEAFFRLGFGMRCADAVADAQTLAHSLPTPSRGVLVREASGTSLAAVVDLAHGLIRHLNGSPSLMAHHEYGLEDLQRQSAEGARFWVAERDGVPVAYLRTCATGENFVTEHCTMRNITGAFCVESARGEGVMKVLLGELARECVRSGETLLGVDFETLNPAAERFWLKHFTPYTYSLARRLDR